MKRLGNMGTPVDVVDLQRRVEVLENVLGIQDVPSHLWPLAPSIPHTKKSNAACPKCGLVFSGAMGYVCNVTDCPTQMRVTC